MDKQNQTVNPVQPDAVSNCTCFNLRKASRVVTQYFDSALKPSGLLITQFTILAAIAMANTGTINELAEILVMDRTTLTRNLKPLEREGWLIIEPGQDQRTRLVSLTASGKAVLTEAHLLWEQAQLNLVKALGDEQWSVLLTALDQTVDRVRDV